MTRRLAEVAKYVGVSEATVSRVLNGKPGISDATRAAVLTALDVLGYERIGIVLGPADHVPSNRKLTAFHAAVGSDAPGMVERTLYSMEGGQAAAARLVKRGVTVIVCASDIMALGAIKAVRRSGLRSP